MFGFQRIAGAVPRLYLADPKRNARKVIELAAKAEREGASVVLFPELALTGYSCADLFHQTLLIREAENVMREIVKWTRSRAIVLVVGVPVPFRNALYNSAAVVTRGEIVGIVPKSFLPNYREFYEKRWFASGAMLRDEVIEYAGATVPFGPDLVFEFDNAYTFGIEICEDLWAPVPPSGALALNGAQIILNPSASNELVGKSGYRRELAAQQSARLIGGYLYVSAGGGESCTDTVFGGHMLAAENGAVIAENQRFQAEDTLLFADIDCEKLTNLRYSESVYADMPAETFRRIRLEAPKCFKKLSREIDPMPFVPSEPHRRDERCAEIFDIQSNALARRIEHVGAGCAVIGISGGLDSTLALMAMVRTFEILGRKPWEIFGISMPGFGTSTRTRKNAASLAKILGLNFREIDITASCLQHFADIGHDPKVHDVTYENVQARERTQILMDIANKYNGIVVGTGDLSEIALGWSTYNADHMSMYNVNCGIPKTLVRYLVRWCADHASRALKKILIDILETPVSPELLPRKKDGTSSQHTEAIIGPYELHDFFLYHAIRYGAPPLKILALAEIAFAGKYKSAEIKTTLKIFWQRFFRNQFKRSCVPDGPKVGTIALSPRADWRMPSDALAELWLAELRLAER